MLKQYVKNLSIFSLVLLLLLLISACGSSAEEESAVAPAEEVATAAAPADTPVPTVMEEEEEATTETDDDDASEAETETEEDVPYSGRAPEDMWTSLACSACHQLDQDHTESNRGPAGPHQGNLAERAAQIAPDQSAEEYVYTSIVDPSAYVVEGYVEGIMPSNYAEQMSEEEIRELARWLLDR